jgi:hypothetical protein
MPPDWHRADSKLAEQEFSFMNIMSQGEMVNEQALESVSRIFNDAIRRLMETLPPNM